MTEDDGIDWAEVARADRAERGECWYRLDTRSPSTSRQVRVSTPILPAMTEKIELAALRRAAKAYEKAQATRDAAMATLVAAMQDADAAGVSRNEIQRVSGLARQTVYKAVAP